MARLLSSLAVVLMAVVLPFALPACGGDDDDGGGGNAPAETETTEED